MQIFRLNDQYQVVAEWKKTRMAFKHEATLLLNGCQVNFKKVCYQNRTWESYTYQTVLRELIYKHWDKDKTTADRMMAAADAIGKGEAERAFAPIKMMAAFAEILCDKPEEKTEFKKKMLSTIPGIDFPADFDQLPEEEKKKRVDGALSTL